MRFLYFLSIRNTFIPKRQKNICQHLFSHRLCLISCSMFLNIQFDVVNSQHESFPSIQKCTGAFSQTFLLFTTFHNLYSSEIQSPLIIKHDNTSSVKEENRLCKNKTDKLVLLCIGGWRGFSRFPFVKRKKIVRKNESAPPSRDFRTRPRPCTGARARRPCVEKRPHVSEPEYYKSNLARGSTNQSCVPNRSFLALLCSYFPFVIKSAWAKGVSKQPQSKRPRSSTSHTEVIERVRSGTDTNQTVRYLKKKE